MVAIIADAALSRVKPEHLVAPALLADIAGEPLVGWQELAPSCRVRRLLPGETLFRQEDHAPHIYAIRSGLLKNVYIDAAGEEWIKSFCRERQVFASIAAMTGERGASFSAVAIEPTIVEIIPFSLLADFADRDCAWARALWRSLLALAARKEARERDLLTLSPEQRYRRASEELGGLLTRVTQKDLSRYLGLTAVGLNRMIRRVRSGRQQD